MFTRLIVKNLPPKITRKKLEDAFSKHGTVTDVKLSYTKDGKFRRFGFVGFKDSADALKAKEYLHNSRILNQKVIVEDCKDFDTGSQTEVKTKKKDDVTDNSDLIISDLDFLKKKKASDADEGYVEENVTAKNQPSTFMLRLHTVAMGLSEKHITEFFHPVKPTSIKISKMKGKSKVIVSFLSQKDLDKGMKFNGDCINGKTAKLQVVNTDTDPLSQSNSTWKDKVAHDRGKIDVEEISESGRLFIRNLAFICTEDDLEALFGKYGTLSEIHIPIDTVTRKNMGIGFVTYMFPEHALKAFNEIDGTAFQGRMIHILPAKAKPEKEVVDSKKSGGTSSYKKGKALQDKSKSQQAYNWNTLFIRTDAVAGAIAEKYNVSKGEFLSTEEKGSTAVRVALGETQIVQETRQFLLDSGISLDSFSQPNAERSKTVILAKNLPAGATSSELRKLFDSHGDLGRVLLAPSGVSAVIEFLEPSHARKAFVTLAYSKFHFTPLYLEWAPMDVFFKNYEEYKNGQAAGNKDTDSIDTMEGTEEESTSKKIDDGATIFVKNLNFDTSEEMLKEHFCKCGEVFLCTISKKKTHKKEELLSMGYGFVQYKQKSDAEKALKTLQNSLLDGHKLELKISKRDIKHATPNLRKKQDEKKQVSSKILVRNVPFQADRRELTNLFKTFGELKSVRLPKKLTVSGQAGTHRGFAFIDFVTKQDAEKAFQALCHSTHLYGRRLVLEWADTEEESIEGLRRKTAERFDGKSKKFKSRDDFEKSLSLKTEES